MRRFITASQPEPPSAEQHALENPGHILLVTFDSKGYPGKLRMSCPDCSWWNEELFAEEGRVTPCEPKWRRALRRLVC